MTTIVPVPIIIPHESSATKRAACEGLNASFDATTATVEQQHAYARCVEILHPSPLTGAELVIAKIAIVLAVAGAVGTPIYVSIKEPYMVEGPVDVIMLGILGTVATPLVVGLIGSLVLGVLWVFS